MRKCLCKLKMVVEERHPECKIHPLPDGIYITEYTAEQMNAPYVPTGDEAQYAYIEYQFKVERGLVPNEHGRWRCPSCYAWVDQNHGWRVVSEERVCLKCYTLYMGGIIQPIEDSQWVSR